VKLMGQSLMARGFNRQVAEIQVRIAVLNRYTALGIPVPGIGLQDWPTVPRCKIWMAWLRFWSTVLVSDLVYEIETAGDKRILASSGRHRQELSTQLGRYNGNDIVGTCQSSEGTR